MTTNSLITSSDITTPDGNTAVQKITRKTLLFLFFWIAEDDPGRNMFSESAHTRMKNIKRTDWYDEDIHKIHCPPVHKFTEFQSITDNWINNYGGEEKVAVKEIGIFSHSGTDGPLIYSDNINEPDRVPFEYRPGLFSYTQLNLNGWSKLNFYWHSSNTRLTFFGCNSAFPKNSFAQNISQLPNFLNVEVAGQVNYSFPSFSPSKRMTSPARSMDVGWFAGDTYMVACEEGTGVQATLFWVNALAMRFYKNGIFLYARTQDFFNSSDQKL